MSLRTNVIANYVGQAYMAMVSIVMAPLYLSYMGTEAYGLIGFFVLMQSLFQLLDLGLGPTLGREVARFRGGALDANDLWRLFGSMERLFVAVGLFGAVAIWVAAGWIASDWLRPDKIPQSEVVVAVALMGATAGARWIGGVYRSVIWGFERQVWLNVFGVAMATLRFVTVIPVFIFVGTEVTAFFVYQLVIGVVEFVVLRVAAFRTMPAGTRPADRSLSNLRGVLGFSLTVAFTSSVWVIVTQADKLMLSGLLPLGEFAYFSLAVLVASTVNLVVAPISQALLPHMTRVHAAGDDAALLEVYRKGTRLTCGIAAPVAVGLAAFAEPIVRAWTGDAAIAAQAAPVMALYAMGNGLLAVAAFQYFLQYAYGDLRLHLIGNLFFLALLVPLLYWSVTRFGAIGAGAVWLSQCAFYLLLWTWLVHRRLAPGLHWRWMALDVLPIWAVVLTVAAALRVGRIGLDGDRLQTIGVLFAVGASLLGSGLAMVTEVRGWVAQRILSERST